MINNVSYNGIPMNNNLNPTYQFINNNTNIKLNNNNNLLSVEEQREENQKRILEECKNY
jgi:hypothetical protein